MKITTKMHFLLLALCANTLTTSAFNLLIVCPQSRCNVTESVMEQLMEETDESIEYALIPITGVSLYEDITEYCSSTREMVSAILDMTDNCQLSELSSLSQVPYLPLYSCSDTLRAIAPDTSVYLRAILDIFTSQGVTTQQMTVFADSSSDMTELLSLADQNDTVQIRALSIAPGTDGYRKDQLQWAVNSRQVGVIGYLHQIRTLLTEVCKLKNRPKSTSWAIVSIDEDINECFGCELNNSLYLRPSHRDQALLTKLTKRLDSDEVNLGFETYEAAYVLYQHWKEISFLNSSALKFQFDICMEPMTSANMTIMTTSWDDDVDAEYPHSFGNAKWNGDLFQQDYRIQIGRYSCAGQTAITETIGQWSPDSLIWMIGGLLWEPEGALLRITTLPEAPFVNREVDENGTVTYSGYSIDVLDEIAKRLKVNYSISEPEDGEFGGIKPDGTWTGMIAEIHRKTADMAVGPISVTAEREHVVDFATPYYDFAGIQIVIKKSKPASSMFTFTTVFSIEVWCCWFSVLGATAILLHAFDRLSHCKCGKANQVPQAAREGFDLKDSFWFVIASLTLSGPEKRPRSFSSRILVTGFWFFCSIMMATYTANLAALLTLSRLSVPVASLDDLLAQSQIRFSTTKGTSMQTYFQRMAEIETNFYEIWKEMSYGNDSNSMRRSRYAVWDYPLPDRYKVIWQQMEETGFVNGSDEGIQRVLNGNYAFFTEAPMIKYKMSQHCNITAVGNQFSAKPYAFALQEKSTLTSVVSGIILELQQERILETLKQKWWPDVTAACGSLETSEGVGIVEMGGIFMLVAAGVVCGVLTLLVELITYKVTGNSKKKAKKAAESESTVVNPMENYRVSLDMSNLPDQPPNT